MPSLARRVRVGVWTSPPKVSGRPKPTSSRRTMRIFGALGGRWFGTARRTWVDSCSVGPAVLAVGTGGNGRTDPSAGRASSAARAGDTKDAANAKASAIVVPRIDLTTSSLSFSVGDGD